jgi:hypothetical protein
MRRRLPHLCALLGTLLACLALAAVAASAASAGGWALPATPLAPSANGPSGAVVAVDPAGDAVAAWTGDDGAGTQSLLVSTRPAGGAWSAPARLAGDVGVDAPSVTIDASGNATIVWIESPDGSTFLAHAARHDAAGGSWSVAPAFAAAGVADPQTQVRADDAGDAVAAWVEHDPSTSVAFVRAAVWHAGAWSAPQTVSDRSAASVAFARPQIAPDASGGAIVAWTAQRLVAPFDYAVQTSTLGGGGTWSAPTDMVSSGEAISPVRLVGADGGDAVATWVQGSPGTLWGAMRTGSAWTVSDVSTDVAPACAPLQALGADAGGGATVVWKAASSLGLDSVRLTAGGWEPKVPVFPDSPTSSETAEDAALDRGTVVFVAHDVGSGADSVLGSRRQGDGSWSRPAALLDSVSGGASLGGVDIASDAAGDALASWTATGALGAKSVAAAAFQAAGPQLSDVSVPASGVPGARLAFSADARSTFATVAQTTWDFGDGSPPAAGVAVEHDYARAGDYTVTITSVDSVGNATQATRQVSVAAPSPTTSPPGTRTSSVAHRAALLRPRVGGIRNGVLVLGRGTRTLKLVVRNPNAVKLTGSATLARPRSGRRRALTLASARRLAFAASRRTTLSLRLSDQALRALRRASGNRLPVLLTLHLRAADGRRTGATLTATLDATARFGRQRARVPAAHLSC